MDSSSAPRPAVGSSRMATTAATISSDYHSLIAEIRKTVGMIKSVAVNLERDKKFNEVKELDDAVLEIIKASDECSYFSSAIQSVVGGYQLGEQVSAFPFLFFFKFFVCGFYPFVVMWDYVFFDYFIGSQPTNFGKLLDDEVNKLKVESPSDPQANSFYKKFKEVVW
ncbi:hypothetical protein Taro_021951, partial [Colocasia esculenta]|nr:hypothetical protein [Colocasia esculenta]